ncbi:reverse transcriptase domain-containing protein [Tanacetum coccineum]
MGSVDVPLASDVKTVFDSNGNDEEFEAPSFSLVVVAADDEEFEIETLIVADSDDGKVNRNQIPYEPLPTPHYSVSKNSKFSLTGLGVLTGESGKMKLLLRRPVMPPRRNRPLTEAYEQEFEQRVMARMEERLGQFVDQLTDRMNDMMNPRRRRDRNNRGSEDEGSENPFFEDDDSSSDDQPDRPRRNQREDNRRWESGMRINIPEFDGKTLNPEGFIDWLVTVEEVFEFKEVPENKRVSLIATKLRGRASAWWQQLKLTRERIGKPRVTSWRKMKKLLRENFIPHNYQRLMYQRLQNLKQGTKSVEDYTTDRTFSFCI